MLCDGFVRLTIGNLKANWACAIATTCVIENAYIVRNKSSTGALPSVQNRIYQSEKQGRSEYRSHHREKRELETSFHLQLVLGARVD